MVKKKIVYHIQNRCISIILCSFSNIDEVCSDKGLEIIEGYLMPDYVHMLVSVLPQMSLSSFMGNLKEKMH